MITFLFICLLPAALLFAALSTVLLAFMLETCAPRSGSAGRELAGSNAFGAAGGLISEITTDGRAAPALLVPRARRERYFHASLF